MNKPTPTHDLPISNRFTDIRIRIAGAGRCLEKLASLLCVGVLLLMPFLFAVAHIAAEGETSNFVTGWQFDPLYDLISTYTSRSPAGWAMVACFVGFAYVLGFISWHAARSRPGFLAWFTCVAAAVGMAAMLQVAWYPIKPTQEGFAEIQREANRKAGDQASLVKTDPALDFKAVAESSHMATPKLDASLRNHWLHNQAIGWAQVCIMLVLIGALFLWDRRDSGYWYWTVAHLVLLLWIGGGFLGRVLLPEFPGLTQRFAYIGFYLWLLVVVREIERRLKISQEPETVTHNPKSNSKPLEGVVKTPHPFLQVPKSHP